MGITTATTLNTEVVIQERKTSNEFLIVEINENISQRVVRAEVVLGPFDEGNTISGTNMVRGSGRRSVTVWQDAEYDAIRDTWTNADLIAVVTRKLPTLGL